MNNFSWLGSASMLKLTSTDIFGCLLNTGYLFSLDSFSCFAFEQFGKSVLDLDRIIESCAYNINEFIFLSFGRKSKNLIGQRMKAKPRRFKPYGFKLS